MDFNKSIFENRKERNYPFLTAHRGVCGANVPCNSIAAYKIASLASALKKLDADVHVLMTKNAVNFINNI